MIRKLTPDGNLITLAGSVGQGGYLDGPSQQAKFKGPSSIFCDKDV